jgi:hypothetical protein
MGGIQGVVILKYDKKWTILIFKKLTLISQNFLFVKDPAADATDAPQP